MIAPPVELEKTDVQGLVAYGYALNRSRHFILHVNGPAKARQFLGEIVNERLITDAFTDNVDVERLTNHGYCPVNIGFTHPGLEKLGLPVPYLRVFQEKAKAFVEGAFLRAARRLADTGASAAERWEKCFKQDFAHVLLSIHADDQSGLDKRTGELRNILGASGLDGWKTPLEGCHLTANRKKRTAHFGLRDGISNPAIKGFHPPKTARKLHEPGELLLGYKNDDQFNPWLLVNPWPLPNPWLLPLANIDPRFFRNGSFAAFRKIEQHEEAFCAFVAKWATKRGVSPEYVRAKLAGRWDDGRVVKRGEHAAPPGEAPRNPADLNDFDFSDDQHGEGCPFGSHIRRMNPRTDHVVPFRRRTLMRRGMPYGPPYQENEPRNGPQRGLLGLFFCASLEDQFEHLLSEWGDSNPMGPYNRGTAKDPLIGNHENPAAVFDIPMPGERLRQLDGFTPFATTRGTLYAFFPGLTALDMIASIGKAAP